MPMAWMGETALSVLSTTTLCALPRRRRQDIVSPHDICANRFHRIKFAGRHLLECGGMENIIDTLHCLTDAVVIPYITDIESQLLVRQRNAPEIGSASCRERVCQYV